MSALFLKIVNMSISASWLVLAVLALRLLLRKAPRWVHVLLWGLVAVRLICPVSIESALSLIPNAETIPPQIMTAPDPTIYSGVPVLNQTINPILSESLAPAPGASANPLQIWIPVLSTIWLAGVAALLLYAAISYRRLYSRVETAVRLWEGVQNVFQSDQIDSPFVLGIIKPKIYLPFGMNERNIDYVLAHEDAHIRRKDHWWKPLGFLLLTLHWFNPLMWLAYALLCRDIEFACDERVARELEGDELRADYSQALLSCSLPHRMITACPLAFGEVGVKERVKSVLSYKKPTFWIVVIAVAACAVTAVCFLTNPLAQREFPMSGRNIADLDTAEIVSRIADAKHLEDGSQLSVSGGDFDVFLTDGFDWEHDGAIRFFYTEDQKIFNAQLRIFPEDNQYFITNSTEWVEQARSFRLPHYLDALKYMPQTEIRQLSPDADAYSVMHVEDGSPNDYDRVLIYSRNGVEEIDGWYIHLMVQPMHEVTGGGYNGIGEDVIHLFYGDPGLVMLEYTEEFEGHLHLGLNAEIIEIDAEKQLLYVRDSDEGASVFGDRCAVDCSYAINRQNLLYVNYDDANEVRMIEFSDFEIGDSVIIGLYDSEKQRAFNGTAVAKQIQLGTQRMDQAPLADNLSEETAERFVSEALSTLTVHEDNTATFSLPPGIPTDPEGKTRLSVTMNATYVIEAGSYDVESFLDSETGWQGGETFTADLSRGEGRLHEVMLRAAFMTEIDEYTAKQYAGDYVKLTSPFVYGQSAGDAVTGSLFQLLTLEGRQLTASYATPEGRRFDILMTLPEGIRVRGDRAEGSLSPYPVILLMRDGQEIGSLVPVEYGATDKETLAAIEQSAAHFPMQIYAPIALSNRVYWGQEGLESYDLPGGNISTVCHPTADDAVISDCVLAYNLQSEPYFLYLSLVPGALSAAELSELAQSVAFT